jgi:hypothetical protein
VVAQGATPNARSEPCPVVFSPFSGRSAVFAVAIGFVLISEPDEQLIRSGHRLEELVRTPVQDTLTGWSDFYQNPVGTTTRQPRITAPPSVASLPPIATHGLVATSISTRRRGGTVKTTTSAQSPAMSWAYGPMIQPGR